jgi:hypothetical protein
MRLSILQKRTLLFTLCIITRLSISLIAKYINKKYLPFVGIITLIMGIGFIYIYLFGNDTANKQLEWTGDKGIWWHHFRPIHGILYMIFSILAFTKNNKSWLVILIDTIFGLILFVTRHYLGWI